MSPITVVNGIQASTVTRVALGELRFFASFITHIAMKSQIASEMSGMRSPAPQMAAMAPPLISGVGLSVWAKTSAAVGKNINELDRSRFMTRHYKFSAKTVNAIPEVFCGHQRGGNCRPYL
jgi:hypothetical protein